MSPLRTFATALTAALAVACSTTASRIREHQAEFDAYPRPVQDAILSGRVEVGFTMQQVALALGRPTRRSTRTSATGEREVWSYEGRATGSRVGFGFGLASGGFDSRLGGGMGVMYDEPAPRERTRVVFEGGKVVVVEDRTDP